MCRIVFRGFGVIVGGGFFFDFDELLIIFLLVFLILLLIGRYDLWVCGFFIYFGDLFFRGERFGFVVLVDEVFRYFLFCVGRWIVEFFWKIVSNLGKKKNYISKMSLKSKNV